MIGRNFRALAAVALLASMQVGGQAAVLQRGAELRAREARREKDQRVDDIFAAMGLRPGAVVADIGAGQGFFTVRLAEAVAAEGRVLAVDISASVVRSLRSRVEQEGLKNVEVIEGSTADPRLPEGVLDAALIVNAYHEMTEHQSMLEHIRRALKPGGRLVIIEPISKGRRDATRQEQARQHEIGPEFVKEDARTAGYEVASIEDPFSDHHGHGAEFMIVLTRPAIAAGAESPRSRSAPRRTRAS
jgi:predicted methyltransferase